ncbi:antibiotic biosynthesis monooxygenase family protein [Novosphingobium aureum]|uniref:antibiotic biosynthesis monooxygenase family protein n=1 Tax=Novosphingobium aureum TaxID=2792964 RepID=UPI002B4680FC|nr:antibiotic biosynthesis monooxygenase [Novosphingobium aureum]
MEDSRELPTGRAGLAGFALLRGPGEADHTLYASHTRWASRDAFEAWTRSDAFRKAHANAGTRGETDKPTYLGPPRFEGFEAVHTIAAPGEEN